MAKKAEKTDDAQKPKDELEEYVTEAKKTSGKTPREVKVLVREVARILEAVQLSKIGEIGIGTYFVPFEGQLGVEGLIAKSAAYMNSWVQQGWQPWQMASPYPGQYAFELGDGSRTGKLDGQWITIIWTAPVEELQV